MDKVNDTITWLKSINQINSNVIKTNQRLDKIESQLDIMTNQNDIILKNQSDGIETIKQLYKKDKIFRNKFTLIAGIILLLLVLFIAFSL